MQILKDLYGFMLPVIKIGGGGDIEWKWVSLIIDELKKKENRVAERIQDARRN
jgi:hypothetical protein